MDAKNLKVGDYAGLSAFQFNFGNVGVYVADNGEKRIYMASNGGNDINNSRNNIVQETKLNGDEIYLKADYRFATIKNDGSSSDNIDKVNFYYSYDGNQWNKIGKEIGMTYDLKVFTGYRNGLFSYPTKNTGGYADFDFFKYDREKWNEGNIPYEEPKKQNQNSSCWSSDLGFPCCSSCTQVFFSDNDGYWSIENDDWCGIPKDCVKSTSNCTGAQDYPCCKYSCQSYFSDSDGDWSVENDDWCLIDKSIC